MGPSLTRDELILSLRDKVEVNAKVVLKNFPLHLRSEHVEDLIAVAWIGAIKAVDGYQALKGASLRTYAGTRIRGELMDYLRSIDHLSRIHRKRVKAGLAVDVIIRQFIPKYENTLYRPL